jgi:glutamate N-acetyltransferase/amino-acid N-acetyltransferase
MPRLLRGIPKAAASLSERGFRDAAEAILTTDTFAKVAYVRARVGGKLVSLLGIAKGSGMIEPNMATMLAFVFTDAAVSPPYLRTLMRRTANETFNRLSIDGETSTSDTALCFANGLARNAPLRAGGSAGATRFESALGEVCESLVRDLARDGEGATKLMRVEVSGAANAAQADRAVRRIANSPLVKTAAFGRDANWGRILQAVGAAQVTIRLDRAVVRLCGVTVFSGGASTGSASRRRAERKLASREIGIEVELGAGRHRAHMWTCDLSYDYVRINAEYTT